MKILVSGDVYGQFDVLFKRVAEVSKKAGPFDLLLCVGMCCAHAGWGTGWKQTCYFV